MIKKLLYALGAIAVLLGLTWLLHALIYRRTRCELRFVCHLGTLGGDVSFLPASPRARSCSPRLTICLTSSCSKALAATRFGPRW